MIPTEPVLTRHYNLHEHPVPMCMSLPAEARGLVNWLSFTVGEAGVGIAYDQQIRQQALV